ncbi:myotubularin-related protein 10-B [Contarinia nasturtii]|uniref:myotubularin-related protein 10-B n=1 Tax=Contarinia nasturtii TaxID=265458 RepID=UPI0012D3E551|nr:myotubularin-related protein 10-B [Contarinia nasturtii]
MYSTIVGIMSDSAFKVKNNFTSYLDTETLSEHDLLQESLKPKLLTGELEVATAKNVILYTTLSNKSQDRENGLCGLLVVTNFKLSFLTSDNEQNITYQENFFLQRNDVTLQNIDRIYQIVDRKKRLVNPYSKINPKLEGLQIVCKNFRVLRFGFKRSELGQGKRIAEALTKFAFPNQHDLLFTYKYNEKYYNTLRNISLYNKKIDWSCELNRCGASNWHVLSLEHEHDIPSGTLPMHFVIPRSLTESEYTKIANSFRNGRGAIWVYSLGNVSLVRLAELMPTITDTRQENRLLEIVRMCDPLMQEPFIMELSKCLPSNQDVQISYTKLRDLLTPESTRQFLTQDIRFYTLLDKTCWLLYVSLCLKYANVAATTMRDGRTVVLQENNGRDMCCVISSLTQLLLDPYFRTISGFESLIQKDWVALGHPFSDRLGHVINSDTSEQSPLLLLFLDCVWQLLQQYPDEFEFSETFLTTLWDSAFLPIFDTFLFNSEHDRQVALKKNRLVLRPVWDWGEQFADKDLALFTNPLYKKPIEQQNNARKSLAVMLPSTAVPLPGLHRPNNARFSVNVSSPSHVLKSTPEVRYLQPNTSIRDLDVWMQCYYRWLPVLEIKNGGNPQIDLFNRMILNRISKLQQDLQMRTIDGDTTSKTATTATKTDDNLLQTMPMISSFFPFTRNTTNTNELTDILATSSELLTEGSIFDGLSIQQAE